ncbi:YDG/SRA domain-containing protein [Microbacterium gorillae]|uniref:YDG/SRA domain-containing protein n=1 Tax=Microbacterium gorillae TaxID=1231063 RepID=UPI000B9B60E5|nr:YDG/SRA domain-containing protein [Microbacterium gorillae]
MTYGPVPGVPTGARFRTRRALYDRRVHHDIRQIICGGPDPAVGAESVLVPAGRPDDHDLGGILYLTGSGNTRAGRVVSDQVLTGLNRILADNIDSGQPVRLIRETAGEFAYDGLFLVEDAYLRSGVDGHAICQFRLRQMRPVAAPDRSVPPAQAQRALATHYRLVRDPAVPARVKALYDHRCQICGIRIQTLAGAYSEGAHLVPLGGGTDGPDTDANVLCLCPNHHVMLDHGALAITDEWLVIDRDGQTIGDLTLHPDHQLDPACARRHRQLLGFPHSPPELGLSG